MANYHDAFPSKYLKAADVTSPRAVKIETVDYEDVGTGKSQESKLVVHFVGVIKGLVLNLINADTIAEITGTDDYERWPGYTIELYPAKTEYQGKRVPCLRIREPAARRPAAETHAEQVPDWVDEPEQLGAEQAGRARDVDDVMPSRPLGEPVS